MSEWISVKDRILNRIRYVKTYIQYSIWNNFQFAIRDIRYETIVKIQV